MLASKKSRLSVFIATLLTFSLISSTPQVFAGTDPEGQYLGIATCCGDVITIIDGGEHEVGEFLNLQAFAEVNYEFLDERDFNPETNNWMLSIGDSTKIIGIIGSGDLINFDEESLTADVREFITSTLIDYGFDETAQYVSYQMSQPVSGFYAGGIFTFSPKVPELIATPALRQTSNLSFDQSQYGSDTLSDPDGQLRKTIDSINAKYGNLIK